MYVILEIKSCPLDAQRIHPDSGIMTNTANFFKN